MRINIKRLSANPNLDMAVTHEGSNGHSKATLNKLYISSSPIFEASKIPDTRDTTIGGNNILVKGGV